jgi:CRP-like cAMP-binding protein
MVPGGKVSPVCSELITALDQNATESFAKAGTVLFRCGDSVSAVYLVRRGRLALEWASGNRLIQLDFAGPGRIVGLPAALNGTYSLTASAVEDTELAFIPSQWVIELLEGDWRLSLAATRMVSREVVRMRSMLRTSFAINQDGLDVQAKRSTETCRVKEQLA